MNKKLLLVEDDADIRELLVELLVREGFVVDEAADGEQGEQMALSSVYDVIVLDIMLPKQDGLDVLRKIRPKLIAPVMLLTAKGESLDRIIGFELGADDYLPKPFEPREFLARIKALIRISERVAATSQDVSPGGSDELVLGDLCIQPKRQLVLLKGQTLELTCVEYKVLNILATRPDVLISRAELTEQALGRKLSLHDRAIDMHLSNLRKKLGDDRIKTVRNAGVMYQVAGQ